MSLFVVALLLCLTNQDHTEALRVPEGDELALVRVVAEGYLANRERMRQFSCKYTLRFGAADSEEAGWSGAFHETIKAECLWLVDNDRMRFEINIVDGTPPTRPEPMPRRDGKKMARVPMLSRRILQDQQYQLVALPEMLGANLFLPGRGRNGLELTPFDMGLMGRDDSLSPQRLAERVVGKLGYCRCYAAPGDDTAAIVFEYGDAPETVGMRFKLAPDKGFLPTELLFLNQSTGQVLSTMRTTEFLGSDERGWMPKRSVVCDTGATTVKVRECVVSELTYGAPDQSLFVIELPKGTTINVPDSANLQADCQKSMVFHLSDLPQLSGRIEHSVKLSQPEEPLPVHSAPGWRVWPVAVNVVLFLIICGYFVLKRMFRGKNGGMPDR